MEVGSMPSGADHLHDNNTDIERAERLNYLADMLSELQAIAAREGCVTLAGLIALSHVEAQQQVQAGKSKAVL